MEQIIHSHAQQTPGATAVIDGASTFTYGELVAESSALAQALKKELDISLEEPVGILLGPGRSQVVAQLAVLLAGGTCVPIEPSFPERRIMSMLQDVQAKHVIMEMPGTLKLRGFSHIYLSDVEKRSTSVVPNLGFGHRVNRSHILFTSGSTGKPKPVQVQASSILHLATKTPVTPLCPEDRVAQFNSPGFDLSLFEIWVTLIAGAAIVVTPRHVVTDPNALPAFLREQGITIIIITAVLFETIAFASPGAFESLHHVLTAGDVANARAMRNVLETRPPRHLWNTYGPTECTTLTTMFEVTLKDTHRERISIGQSVGDMKVILLDEDQKPVVGCGRRGEICIGGPQQSIGYFAQPSETEKSFLRLHKRDLGIPGGEGDLMRLYRTGDIGAWQYESRCLDFLGRSDTQIKFRGFRVELGEIECVLQSHEEVQAVVVARQPSLTADGMEALVAFVVPKDMDSVHPEDLRDFASKRLPQYMLPNAMEFMERFPLTANGKLDRKALIDGRLKMLEEQKPLQNGTKEKQGKTAALSGLCKKILNIPQIHEHDDLFALGATSLQAATLLALVQDHLGCMVSMEDLYSHPTLSSLSQLIELQESGSTWNAPDNTRLWLEDVSRVDDIELLPHWESEDEGKVFITGATGFVGAHFLHRLFCRPSVKQVACLARSKQSTSAATRIRQALERYDLWADCAEHEQKLIVLDGDLVESTLGLGTERFNWLANWASIIFHLGAKVNFCESYREHHRSNVIGTCNALRLAAAGRRKAFHYFSTIDVWGPTGLILGTKELYEDEPLMPHSQAVRYDLGYSGSQWTAESMVRRMRDRGLPTVIYRPGFIIGDSVTGHSNPDDFMSRVIVGCIQLGTFPRLDQRLEYVTLDYVVSAAMHIASSNESLGRSYSLLSPDQSNSVTVVDTCRVINEAGYPVKIIDYNDWVEQVFAKQRPDGPLASLLPMFRERVLGRLTRWEVSQYTPYYRSDNTVEALKDRPDLQYQPLDAPLLKKYISFWNRKGFYKV
ncbi:putative NRPS-like enzyme [Aspergillus bombycis]|uniref:Putative NRPS-like enzyme n=1 Tax=Aspergillus bombycis TaxID=109264 RepID=A0A1F7ZLJ3_9EURO|nr:putative NRPS-like enzyme [Aspergillus bombycis]OGM40337.1 putative NRPS-like enzyme [Aspergillus bombycis]